MSFRWDRGQRRHSGQVHRRKRYGLFGRTGGTEEPCNPRLLCGACHPFRHSRRQQGESGPRGTADTHAHRHPFGRSNIGKQDRINYTVIGDDVNVAQRLEQIGKQVLSNAEAAISISAATVADLDSSFDIEPVGEMEVMGSAGLTGKTERFG